MATRTAAEQAFPGNRQANWAGLLTTDVGSAVELGQVGFRGVTCQAIGTFGVGGSINIQGSQDGINWGTLGSISAAGGVFVPTSVPRFMRPSVAGGDGTTNITVSMVW